MTWNHRIVKITEIVDGTQEYVFSLQEVYYNDEKKPEGYCEPSIVGDSVEEVKAVIEDMLEAFNRPILDEAEILQPEKSTLLFSKLFDDRKH
jgi:hypothetical protein